MNTKAIIHVGLALIFLGIATLTYRDVTTMSHEKVINIGPLQATIDPRKIFPLSPLVGGLVLVGGIVLVFAGIKKSS